MNATPRHLLVRSLLLLLPVTATCHAADGTNPPLPTVNPAQSSPTPVPLKETDPRLGSNGSSWGLQKAVITDPSLPRVLLIGDSILGGYHANVIKALHGRANVDVWKNPYWQSDKVNQLLSRILENGPYDVIHANMGLHGWTDWGTPKARIQEGTFEPLTRAYIQIIRTKFPNARIIWATTTPLMIEEGGVRKLDPVKNPIILEQNRMATKVMGEMNVEVDDLYPLVANRLQLARGGKDIAHLTPQGYVVLGDAVTRSVGKNLPVTSTAHPAPASRP